MALAQNYTAISDENSIYVLHESDRNIDKVSYMQKIQTFM